MIEEQHVTRYAGLLDPCATDLERMVLGQYIECYLYYSCMESECDARIRGVWSEMFEREAAHLQFASGLLERFEGKDWRRVIPGGEFPPPLRLISGAGYVRDVLSAQVELTAVRECYVPAGQLPEGSDFERYQRFVNGEPATAPSHRVIEAYIGRYGTDYRFEAQPHPIEALQNRRADSTRVGRPSPATKKASR